MPRTRSSRLVGRASEKLRLHEGVESANGGALTVLLIDGEPGIGKSRLVRESTSELVVHDHALMVGHGVDLTGGELPFGVVADALRDLVRQEGAAAPRDRSPKAAATLGARLVDELARDPAVQRMHHDRLSRDDVATQIRDLLKQAASRGLLDRAVEFAQGVPFLTKELVLGGLRAQGPLPANMSELMLDRVDGLSRPAVTVVQACAFASGHLWHGLLAKVCELPDGRTCLAV